MLTRSVLADHPPETIKLTVEERIIKFFFMKNLKDLPPLKWPSDSPLSDFHLLPLFPCPD
jgi:hypothetical protein